MNVQQKLALKFIRAKLNLLSSINKKKAGEVAFRLFCTPLAGPPYKKHEVFLSGTRLQFSLNGQHIKGHQFNSPANEKVMILHGFSSSGYNFHSYVQPLIDKGYEVLVFDAPAHGDSGGSTVNAVEYKDMIIKVVELYGPVNKYVAHSFGGIAIILALEELPHTANTKVALIAPATETSTAIDSAFSMLSIKNPSLRASIDDIIFKISGKETSWFSIRRAIKNISAKILWIHDEEDDITPLSDALQVKADMHSNVQFIITSGLGHRKIYRDPAVRKQIIDFL